MDLDTKLKYAEQAARNIAGHDDEDIEPRLAALDRLRAAIDAEVAEARKRDDALTPEDKEVRAARREAARAKDALAAAEGKRIKAAAAKAEAAAPGPVSGAQQRKKG